MVSKQQIDWSNARERIDLYAVTINLLGPPPGRRGDRRGRPWWNCPLGTHEDRNPSFTVDAERKSWRCYGCGGHGDAASLIMKVRNVPFPEAKAELMNGSIAPAPARPKSPPTPWAASPSGLPPEEALAVVLEAEERLWSPAGAKALEWLTATGKTPLGWGRCLTYETIKAARLGWGRGGCCRAWGIAIPWFDRGRLCLVKVRPPDGSPRKYLEIYRDNATAYPGFESVQRGVDLVAVEGEFEALVLQQALGDRAVVLTLGSASGRLEDRDFDRLTVAPRWWIATDNDENGEKAAACWPRRGRRVRPPGQFKDWTEAARAGVNLRRWWSDLMAGNQSPNMFTWDELAQQRWGPALGPVPETIAGQPVDTTPKK